MWKKKIRSTQHCAMNRVIVALLRRNLGQYETRMYSLQELYFVGPPNYQTAKQTTNIVYNEIHGKMLWQRL